ncbi:MAG: hypothetical protein K5776_07060 [Lachnospiraceae bacterium]|nr:hypothetical protein [Lachnospiraceae bacterium]
MKTKRILLISLIIYAFLFVPCILLFFFSRGKEVYYDPAGFLVNAGEETVIGENLKLSPGIYKISFDYSLETDELYGGFCNVSDEGVRAGGLECTGSPIYDGLSRNEFEIYLSDFTETLDISVTAYTGEINLSGLTVKNTGKSWLVLLSYLTVFTVLVDLVLIFVQKVRDDSIKSETKTNIFCLVLIWLFASIPLLLNNTLSSADNGYHMQRIEGVASAILSGQIPVRLEPHWLQGHGYANGVFYCDLFLIIPALARIIGFSVTDSFNIYCLILTLCTVLAAFKAFEEIYKKNTHALILTALYSLSTIHFHKFIQLGNLGEGTASVFLPLVMLGVYRIFYTDTEEKGYKKAFLPLALGMAGMINCHVLSSEISAMVLVIICILNIKKFAKLKVWRELFKAAGTALLLSLWFIVPFLDYYITQDVHVKHVFARTIQEMAIFFPEIYMNFWGDQTKPTGLGIALTAGLFAFLIIRVGSILLNRKEKDNIRDFADVFFVIAIVTTIMSIEWFPWNKIQSLGGFIGSLVSSFQFPSRFLEWGTIASVAVFGYLLLYFEKKRIKTEYAVCIVLAFLSLLFSSVYLNDIHLAEDYRYMIANVEGIGNGYISGAEYILEGTDESKLHYSKETAGPDVETSGYQSGNLKAALFVKNNSSDENYVDVPFLNYKGYRAKDSKGNNLKVVTGENNLVRVIIPGGFSDEISVKFVSPIYWRIAEIISLLSLAALIVYLIKENSRKRILEGKEAQKEESEEKTESSVVKDTAGSHGYYEPANEKALAISRSVLIMIMTVLFMITPIFSDDNIRQNSKVFFIPLVVIVYYIAVRMLFSLIVRKKEEKIFADFGSALYILSPMCVYTLFNRYAVADFATLCLPVFSKHEAGGIFEIPLKTALLFNTFIYKGAYNYKLYLAHPIQLSPTFVMMLTVMLLIVAVRIVSKKKALTKEDLPLIISLAVTELIWFVGTLPLPFDVLSSVSGVFSPVGAAALANVINSVACVLFMKRVSGLNINDNKKKLILEIFITLAVLSAVFQLNDLFLESRVFIN